MFFHAGIHAEGTEAETKQRATTKGILDHINYCLTTFSCKKYLFEDITIH